MTSAIEPLFSFQQISAAWHASEDHVRKLFRARRGLVNIAVQGKKPVWRIPASLVLEVMVERGYTREAADRLLKGESAE